MGSVIRAWFAKTPCPALQFGPSEKLCLHVWIFGQKSLGRGTVPCFQNKQGTDHVLTIILDERPPSNHTAVRTGGPDICAV